MSDLTYGQTIQVEGFQAQLDMYGRTLTALDESGIQFRALLSEQPPIDPLFDLGSDLREVTYAQILRPVPNLHPQVQLKDDSGVIWKWVKLIDNPSTITAILHLIQVVPEDSGGGTTPYVPPVYVPPVPPTPAVPATRLINTDAPLNGGGDLSADRTISITQSGTNTDGYLSSEDWDTFNTASVNASDALLAAGAALSVASSGSNAAYEALGIAVSGTDAAANASSIAISGSNLAVEALAIAIAGTNLATSGSNLAYSASITATSGSNLAYSASTVKGLVKSDGAGHFSLAVSGTDYAPGMSGVPVGCIIAFAKSLTGTPAMPAGYVECNGQTLSDVNSVYNGVVIPNLNGTSETTKRFLRGATTSGGTGGTATHNHGITLTSPPALVSGGTVSYLVTAVSDSATIPIYYEVVYIMRVK